MTQRNKSLTERIPFRIKVLTISSAFFGVLHIVLHGQNQTSSCVWNCVRLRLRLM